MMTMTLRQLIHPNDGHSTRPLERRSVEELQSLIDRLTAERQQLRTAEADREVLEHNRREIASAQWELSYALIERYLPAAA